MIRKILERFYVLAFLVFLNCKDTTNGEILQKPNVLLIYMDDLRPELSSFGASQILSPNIDDLANKGVKFTNAYCNVPVC